MSNYQFFECVRIVWCSEAYPTVPHRRRQRLFYLQVIPPVNETPRKHGTPLEKVRERALPIEYPQCMYWFMAAIYFIASPDIYRWKYHVNLFRGKRFESSGSCKADESSSHFQFSYRLQCLAHDHLWELVLYPVPSTGSHNRSNARVRMKVFHQAEYGERRICNQDNHF